VRRAHDFGNLVPWLPVVFWFGVGLCRFCTNQLMSVLSSVASILTVPVPFLGQFPVLDPASVDHHFRRAEILPQPLLLFQIDVCAFPQFVLFVLPDLFVNIIWVVGISFPPARTAS
jgi:hypothetical protein